MDRECKHIWTVNRIKISRMGKMTVGTPIYKCKKCGKEKE